MIDKTTTENMERDNAETNVTYEQNLVNQSGEGRKGNEEREGISKILF